MKKRKVTSKELLPNHSRELRSLRRFSLFFYAIALSSAILLGSAGCSGEAPSPPISPKGKSASIEKKKNESMKGVEKKEPAKEEEIEYTYNPSGKSDPFKPFFQLTPVKAASKNAPQTPLQNYEISQLKLVGILATPDGNIALIEDSLGKGYFLKKGTWIGKNDGKVTKILNDKIVIEETFQDIFGKTKMNEVIISLHRSEEEGEQ